MRESLNLSHWSLMQYGVSLLSLVSQVCWLHR